MIKRLVEQHFEMIWETTVLLIIYVVGATFLAKYGEPMLLTAWLTGGVVVGAIVRAFQTPNKGENRVNQSGPGSPEKPDQKPE